MEASSTTISVATTMTVRSSHRRGSNPPELMSGRPMLVLIVKLPTVRVETVLVEQIGNHCVRRLSARMLSFVVAVCLFGPSACRSGEPTNSLCHREGFRSSAASDSSGVGKDVSGSAQDQGATEACSTISSRPPGDTARAAACKTCVRGNSTGECRNRAETRSYWPSGKVLARSCRWNSMRSETPAVSACFARARTVPDTSTATTRQLRCASQIASSP